MEPAPWMRFHPFVATLEHWASGVSALCGEPWSEAAICAAIERGPHTSALTPEARDLIDEEMKYQIQAGFSEMVLWRTIQHAYPTNLKVYRRSVGAVAFCWKCRSQVKPHDPQANGDAERGSFPLH